MSTQTNKQRTVRRYSDAFKRQVVEQIEEGTYTQPEAAEVYGCSQSSIHRWLKQHGKNHLLNKVVRIQTMDEPDRIKELTQQIDQLKQALADAYMDQQLTEARLELACKRLGVDPEEFKKKTRRKAIQMNSETYTISDLCRLEGISRQSWYQAMDRAAQRRKARRQVLEWVRAERAKHPRMGGRKLYQRLSPRMQKTGIKMGRDKLFGLLRANDLLVSPRRSGGPRTTNGAATQWSNRLAETQITTANQAWVADITYLRTFDGFCYLALISDVHSRKILGWDVSDSLELEGALDALRQALQQCPESVDSIHHSDCGSQYRSNRYVQTLTENGCTISMTEEDHCAENAQAERLNGILKNEYLLDQVFHNTEQARQAARKAINLYNTDRPHLSLNYNTPEQVHRAA